MRFQNLTPLLVQIFALATFAGCTAPPDDGTSDNGALKGGGTLDESFDGDGRLHSEKIEVELSAGLTSFSRGIYLADGSMLLSGQNILTRNDDGTVSEGPLLVKVKRDGRVDRSFGSGGRLPLVRDPKGGVRDANRAPLTHLVPREGGFWAVHSLYSDSFAVAYSVDGSRVSSVPMLEGRSIVPDTRGRLIVQSCSFDLWEPSPCRYIRYLPTGLIDSTFTAFITPSTQEPFLAGNDGLLIGSTYVSSSGERSPVVYDAYRRTPRHMDSACTVAFAKDGSMFATFIEGVDRTVVRKFTRDWLIDSSFGNDGEAVIPWARGDDTVSRDRACVTLDSKGNVLVVGVVARSTSDRLGVARLLPDGSFDSSFDEDGRINIDGMGGLFTPLSVRLVDGALEVMGYDESVVGMRLEAYRVLL